LGEKPGYDPKAIQAGTVDTAEPLTCFHASACLLARVNQLHRESCSTSPLLLQTQTNPYIDQEKHIKDLAPIIATTQVKKKKKEKKRFSTLSTDMKM